jgi:hypothetical protein
MLAVSRQQLQRMRDRASSARLYGGWEEMLRALRETTEEMDLLLAESGDE